MGCWVRLARLKDAALTNLSLDSRFDLAYNAAHAFSLAALRWHGYRSENRYTVFQCLEHTVKLPPEQWRVLDQAHRKRNLAEYEGHLDVDNALVDALIRVAQEVASRVRGLGPIADSGEARQDFWRWGAVAYESGRGVVAIATLWRRSNVRRHFPCRAAIFFRSRGRVGTSGSVKTAISVERPDARHEEAGQRRARPLGRHGR